MKYSWPGNAGIRKSCRKIGSYIRESTYYIERFASKYNRQEKPQQKITVEGIMPLKEAVKWLNLSFYTWPKNGVKRHMRWQRFWM